MCYVPFEYMNSLFTFLKWKIVQKWIWCPDERKVRLLMIKAAKVVRASHDGERNEMRGVMRMYSYIHNIIKTTCSPFNIHLIRVIWYLELFFFFLTEGMLWFPCLLLPKLSFLISHSSLIGILIVIIFMFLSALCSSSSSSSLTSTTLSLHSV